MSLIWTLLYCAVGGAIIFAAWFTTQRFHVAEYLRAMFLDFSSNLPTWMSLEQFLAAVVVFCVMVAALAISLCAAFLIPMRWQVSRAQRRQAAQEAAIQRAIEQLKAQVRGEYERLIGLSATLTQRLDKRALLQSILQAAGQLTSLPQADSAVGLWALDFETDRMRFEMGFRCDETFFAKHQLELAEFPFMQLVSGKQVLRFPKWSGQVPFIVAEKASQLGQLSAMMLIPLVIERTVLGCLVVFCHPDFLKGYDEQQTFFNAAWGQLAIALAIAIQGELAILDRLTGIVNQAYFLKRLAEEIERCNRYQLPLGLLMIDIDDFKTVNDTLGHPQGDAVLKIVARLIKKEVRAIDLVGRYGGEEFIVMLPETGLAEGLGGPPPRDAAAQQQEAQAQAPVLASGGAVAQHMASERKAKGSSGALIVAERIRKVVEEEFRNLQRPLAITISIGVAVRHYPQDRQRDARDLIRVADEQLYKAKTTGKNRCCVYVPQEQEPLT